MVSLPTSEVSEYIFVTDKLVVVASTLHTYSFEWQNYVSFFFNKTEQIVRIKTHRTERLCKCFSTTLQETIERQASASNV